MTSLHRFLVTIFFVFKFGCLISLSVNAATLDDVKTRGRLNCGVAEGLPGFSEADAKGSWTGFDADFCRAISAAIFGDPSRINFIPLSLKQRISRLQSGEVDVVTRLSGWTMQTDTTLGISFIGILYHDGQALMARKKLEIQSALELSGSVVCVTADTAAEANIADFFRTLGMSYKIITFKTSDDALKAYEAEQCDVYSSEASALFIDRLKLSNPSDHVILPDLISKEPLSPAVRQSDLQWENIVRWTLFALINAEELGVTKDNADAQAHGAVPSVRRLLGMDGDFGRLLGLDKDWAFRAIKAVGNYGEMFAANLGEKSPLKMERGINKLWNKGGIMYAPPVR